MLGTVRETYVAARQHDLAETDSAGDSTRPDDPGGSSQLHRYWGP